MRNEFYNLNNTLFLKSHYVLDLLSLAFGIAFKVSFCTSIHIHVYGAVVFFQSLAVHNFYFGEGSDITGVPTKMLTMNCSMRMSVYNPATFFGIHVSSTTISLMYSDIAVATGQVRFLASIVIGYMMLL